MEADLLVKWTKNGRRVLQNRDQPKYHSVNGNTQPLSLTISDQNCKTVQPKSFSLSGSSDDDEMIDITACGGNMDSHLEQAHSSHGMLFFLIIFDFERKCKYWVSVKVLLVFGYADLQWN